jgi:CubicO group peptidase (beta-lactamase class C family)
MTNARPSGLFPHAPSGRFSYTARFPSLFSCLEAMIRRYTTVLSLTLSLAAQAGAQQPSIAARLHGFDDDMARLLETWNVPGIGVGIVVKQKLVFAKGYGYRDYGRKIPYTPTTTQPIASNTKLFTAVAAGLLVNDGKLDWDTPIRTYVPSIKFSSDDLDRTITMRDMLSHRTGIARHDGIWYKSDFTQKDLFDRLRYLDASAPPRTTFLYNNVMYSGAGYAIELLAGKPWQTFVTDRILRPLGMTGTTFTVEDMLATPEPAVPYSEVGGETALTQTPYYSEVAGLAPAGAINSSVVDMSHWLIALMNGGVYNGAQVIPQRVIRETLAPSIAIANTDLASHGWSEILNRAYGMGRFTASYRGHLVAYHNGDIRGFHSQLSMMPNDSIGVIVMVIGDHAAPLYNVVSWNIYERLLGLSVTSWSERLNAIRLADRSASRTARAKAVDRRVMDSKPSHPLADYVGEFENPAYGVLSISQADTSLVFGFHRIRLPLSHFHYDRFDTADDEQDGRWSVNFLTSATGEVDRAEMSIDDGVIVFRRRIPAALTNVATLRQYLGTYGRGVSSIGRFDIVLRADTSLAIRDSGGGLQDLVPVRPNQFRMSEFPEVVFEFSVVDGRVTALKASDPAGEITFSRQ